MGTPPLYTLAEKIANSLKENGHLKPGFNEKDVVDCIFYKLEEAVADE